MRRHSWIRRKLQACNRRNRATQNLENIVCLQNKIIAAACRGDHDLADELLCIDLEDAEHELEAGR